jgi:Holliday junction resolvasome RuvABC ATP-dependent DNA helicase subunit
MNDKDYVNFNFDNVIGQRNQIFLIQNLLDEGKYPSASLFLGESGIGKSTLAEIVAMTLSCEKKGSNPCMECSSCLDNKRALLRNSSSKKIAKINAGRFNSRSNVENIIEEIFTLSGGGIYIIEEFHGFSEKEQEMLLEEISKLDESTYVIFTTNKKFKVVPQLRNGRVVKFELKTPMYEENLILAERMQNRLGSFFSDFAIQCIVKNSRNIPREIVSTMRVLHDGRVYDDARVLDYVGHIEAGKYVSLLEAMQNDMRKFVLYLDTLGEVDSLVRGLKDFSVDLVCSLFGGMRKIFLEDDFLRLKKVFEGWTESEFLNFIEFVGKMQSGMFGLVSMKRFFDKRTTVEEITQVTKSTAKVEQIMGIKDIDDAEDIDDGGEDLTTEYLLGKGIEGMKIVNEENN